MKRLPASEFPANWRSIEASVEVDTASPSAIISAFAMPDVFISYAHADDEVPAGAEYGWVTTFKEELRKRLRQKLGATGADIWMDHSLAANDVVTPTLLDAVRRSRTLLLFLSPSYHKSAWCQTEVGKFLEINRAHKNKENVFVVELEPVDRTSWHPRLRELTPVCFWEKTPVDDAPRLYGYPTPDPKEKNPYWLRLNELAHLIARHLKGTSPDLLDGIERPSSAHPAEPRDVAKPVIWIADPTDDMIDRWYELAAAIRQTGGELLPRGPGIYHRTNQESLSLEVGRDLKEALLAIQLMGGTSGERFAGSETTRTALQNSLAREWARKHERAFMQWRPMEISAEDIARTADGGLLTGAIACGFAEFCQLVVTTMGTLSSRSEPAPWAARTTLRVSDSADGLRAETSPTICVTSAQQDKELGSRVAEILYDLGANTLAAPDPVPHQLASDFRASLDRIIQNSQGVVIVYGHSPPSWVQAQYTQAWRVLAQRPPGIWGALLDGPPPEKPPHGVRSRNLMTLDCRNGSMSDNLARFVDALRRAAYA